MTKILMMMTKIMMKMKMSLEIIRLFCVSATAASQMKNSSAASVKLIKVIKMVMMMTLSMDGDDIHGW